jgi:hypothetical protein
MRAWPCCGNWYCRRDLDKPFTCFVGSWLLDNALELDNAPVFDNKLSLVESENLCSIHWVTTEDMSFEFLTTLHISNWFIEELAGVLVMVVRVSPWVLYDTSLAFSWINMVDFRFRPLTVTIPRRAILQIQYYEIKIWIGDPSHYGIIDYFWHRVIVNFGSDISLAWSL